MQTSKLHIDHTQSICHHSITSNETTEYRCVFASGTYGEAESMNHLYYATKNEAVFSNAKDQLERITPSTVLDRFDVDIPEIEASDPSDIIKKKIEYIRSQTTKPVIVDGVMLSSGDKFVREDADLEYVRSLIEDGERVRAIACLAFSYLSDIHTFNAEVQGVVDLKGSQANRAESAVLLDDGTRLDTSLAHRSLALGELARWLSDENNGIDVQREVIGKRWTDRSAGWKGMIEDSDSYVNFEGNYARVNEMIRRIAPRASGEALEIGCGTGEAGRILKEVNPSLDLLSTDISAGMLKEAREQTAEAGLDINYREADITKVDLGTDKYGMILSRGVVLSHLPRGSVYDFLESATRMAKDNAYFLFDFMQSEKVGDVEKPVDTKNEFSIAQMDAIMDELGWVRVDNDGEDDMRVRVVCYKKVAA